MTKTPPSQPSEAAQRIARLTATILDNPYIPIRPTQRQLDFLNLTTKEALFGGAAGGGKSAALLASALQYVSVPGYAAIIFRLTYTDLSLPGALMEKAHEWLDDTDAHWSALDKTWRFPSGATLTFGYLSNDADRFRYRSAEFQFVGFDEVTDSTLLRYSFMFSRLRRLEGHEVPIRMRCASNPDGPGADWVRSRFVDGAPKPGKPYIQTVKESGESWQRAFIPALLDDNPHLDQDAYRESLANLDPVTRRQLLMGDWTVRHTGGMLDRSTIPIIDAAPPGLLTARGWDLAGTRPKHASDDPDWTRGTKWGLDTNTGKLYVIDLTSLRGNPGEVEAHIAATAALDGIETIIGLPQDPGQAGKAQIAHYVSKVLQGFVVNATPESGDKIVRARPWMAAAANGLVSLVRGPWNQAWLSECEAFPRAPHDDIVDANSRTHATLTRQQNSGAWAVV